VQPDLVNDVRDEVDHHLRESVDALKAQGWTDDAAWAEARRRFGELDARSAELVAIQRTRARREASWERLWSIGSDVRFALRTLRGRPLFAWSVILTLSLGAGAATGVFSVLDAVLLRPLPWAEPDRLVEVRVAGRQGGALPLDLYEGWRDAAEDLTAGWLAYSSLTLVRTDRGDAEFLMALAVTPGAERVAGIPLWHGRGFVEEDATGGQDVVVLTGEYFERLGADPAIVGTTVRLGTGPATVVGVLRPVRFPDYGGERDLWVPIRADGTASGTSLRSYQGAWARIHEGVPLAAVREAVSRIAGALQAERPRETGWGIDLLPLGTRRAQAETERSLWLLSGTVGLILLIALLNSANLVGIHALARSRELGIRTALGGSRPRVLRQLLAEGLVLGLLSGACSAAFAWVALAGIERIVPEGLTFFSVHALGVERRAILFAFVASLGAGAVLGLLPAGSVLRDRRALWTGLATDDTRAMKRARSVFVIGQVTISMALLVGGALFVGSLLRLVRVDPGFDFRRIAEAVVIVPELRYPTDRDRAQYLERLTAALDAHPSIAGATSTGGGSFMVGASLEAEGVPVSPDQPPRVPYTTVEPDYFEVTGAVLLFGRGFLVEDAGRDVAIIDADLARFLWGTENVVGRRFRTSGEEWTEVVGVARDLRLLGRDQRDGPYQILYPRSPDRIWPTATLLVRAEDPRAALPVIREVVRSIDPEQTFWRLRTGSEALAEPEDTARFLAVLMSLLAGIGLAVAAVGVFAVLAYSVRRRARELGIRKALGAGDGALATMVLGDGLRLAAVGLVLGLGGAALVSGTAESLLYEVDPHDARLFAAAALLLLAVVTAATLLPARSATAMDPLEVLKAE
jgi:putative ABC transport system permease protein